MLSGLQRPGSHTFIYQIPDSSVTRMLQPILLEAKLRVEKEIRKPVIDVYIAVPGHFDTSKRQAIKAVGSMVGLNVRAVVSQVDTLPAAYQFESSETQDHFHIVVDYNRASLDMALVNVNIGVSEVVTYSTDPELGEATLEVEIAKFLFEHRSTGEYTTNVETHHSAIRALTNKVRGLRKIKNYLNAMISNFDTQQPMKASMTLDQLHSIEQGHIIILESNSSVEVPPKPANQSARFGYLHEQRSKPSCLPDIPPPKVSRRCARS